VKLSYVPEGGQLLVDGRPGAPLPRKFLAFGTHKLTYTRPGHTDQDFTVELGPGGAKACDFKLTRTASTVTLYVQAGEVEVLLDGKSLGHTAGRGGPEAAQYTEPLGLKPEDVSAPFLIPELLPGKHRLELRAPCFRTEVRDLGPDLATPARDVTLVPIRMEPSRGTLSVQSPWPGGELFLNGQSYGPLPVVDLPACSGTYDLLVRFPAGGFSQRITVEAGKGLSLEARPKPRLAFLGLEAGDFTGRARILAMLEAFGERLQQVAYLQPPPDLPPAEVLARVKASREAELVLMAAPVPDKVIHQVELVLATLDGEEERLTVKPLEQDPLGALAERLNAVPPIRQLGLGLSLLDLPGEPGPWVLAASESAQKAGVQVGKPLLQVQGRAVPTTRDVQRALEGAKEAVSITQEGATATLPLQWDALEIPLGSAELSYPVVVAQLRLQFAGAKGGEAELVRFNLALALMQFRKYDKAIELLRDARLSSTQGVSQGTIDYHTGLCFLHLGSTYQAEAVQAFRQALKSPLSTLLGPDGPPVAPLAKQALEDLK
jgi:hypothetical protein